MIVAIMLFGIPMFSGDFAQAEEQESQTILQDHILYTLYSDGTAEVTQVGEDQKPSLLANRYEEGDNYEAIHERDQVYLEDITIPKAIHSDGKEYAVTSIGAKAFVGSFRYRKISLPETITYIGDYAFYQRKIEEISLPDSVTEMGVGVFEDTEVEGELVFPASMDTVPSRTFYRTSARRLVIPDTVTKLELYQPGRAERRKGITESDYQGKEAAGNRREAKDASEHQCAEQQYFQV